MKKLWICISCIALTFIFSGCQAEQAPAQDNGPDAGILEEAGNNTVIDTILQSYSSKEFVSGIITEEDLELIITSGAKAPSARNMQPWHFTVIKNTMATEMIPIAQEGNVIILVSGLDEQEPGINVDFDCALAVQNINIAAQSLGYGTHIYTGGIDQINENQKEALSIPDGYHAISMILIGTVPEAADITSTASVRNPIREQVNIVE